jgi:glycine/D-amino acid oxidase-like deaminating enzyme
MPVKGAPSDSRMDESALMSAYGDSWFAATTVAAPRRPALTIDLDADVCVIGGGLAGLTVAREIARKGWSVVLLEAGRLAARASGRNTGFVVPGFTAGPDSIVSRVGFEHAKDLWTLSQSGLDYVRSAISDDAMPGIDPQDGWLYVSKTDNGDELTRLAGLIGEFGGEIEGWPTDRVRAVLRSERYFHAIYFPRAINIHPLNYAFGLAAAAERAGARIFENTPALSIDPAGVRKRIVTPHARLRANHVVLCGNLQIGKLAPYVGSALIPLTTYVITTGPLGDRLKGVIDYWGSVSDSDLADNHYRIVGGDRLMWSGRATTWRGNPRRYVRALTSDIERTFPALGGVGVDYAWCGTLGVPIHRMPQIGELAPGVWLASGFGGHGLNTTAIAGNLIARAVVSGDQTWRQFTPFELVWAGGFLGRVVTQVYYWRSRFRTALAGRRARSNELAQRIRTPQTQSVSELRPAAATEDMPGEQFADSSEPPHDSAKVENNAEPVVATRKRRRRKGQKEDAQA